MADEIRQTILIEATLTKLQQDLEKIKGEFKSTFSQIASTGNQILSTLGVGLSVGAVVAFGKSIIDLGDQLSDLSDQTGLTINTLGGIKPILDSSNSSLDAFAKGFGKFKRSLGDFEGAGKEAAEALKAIKLDPAQLVNASPDKALQLVVDGLGKVENANERAAIAGRLFSKSAEELIPTVLQLAQNGIPKLDAATASAYESLGKLKDQLTFAKAAIANISVQPLVAVAEAFFDIGKDAGNLLQGLNEVVKAIGFAGGAFDVLTTAAKGASYVFDLGAFSALALTESLLKILRVAPLVAEALTFNKIDFGSSNFTKAIEGVEQQMENISTRFLGKFDPSKNLVEPTKKKPQGAFQGLLPPSASTDALKNATKAAQAFLETIDKEIIKLQESNIAFFQGADAAKKFALEQELAAKKQQVVAELIGRGISPANANKAVAQAFAGIDTDKLAAKIAAARDEFIQLAREALNSKDALQKVFAIQDADKLKDQFTAVINRIHEAQAEIKDPDLVKGTVQAIEAEFKKAQDQTKLFADVFGDAFDKSGHEVDDLRAKLNKFLIELKGQDKELVIKTKAELDQKSVDDVKANLQKQIDQIQERGAILGPSQVNVPQEISQAQRQAIDRLNAQRTPQARAEAQQIAPQEAGNRAAGVINDLDQQMREATVQAQVFGGAFDLPRAQVDNLTNAMQRLIHDGLDEFDPRLQKLKADLEDAKAAEHFADAFKEIGQAVGDAFNQLAQGGKLKDVLKNLTSQIQRAITDALVTKPFQELLQKLANDIFGIKTGGAAGGQEASTKVFSTSTNQFAAAVQQFAAVAGVRGAGAPLPTGFGERPAGVEGPTLPNGGFFGTPQDTGTGATAGAGGESLIAEPGQALKGFLDALGAGIFGGFPLPGGVGLGGILGGIFGLGKGKGGAGGAIGAISGGVTSGASDQVAIAGIQAQVTAAQASIEALSTEASTSIQGVASEASGAIDAASTAGTTAIETTGSTAEAAITAVQAEAIAAIQAAAAAAQSSSSGGSSMGGGGGFGMFGGLFGGLLGGGGSGAASGTGEAGAASAGEFAFAHTGGAIGKLHSGGTAMDLSSLSDESAQKIVKQLASIKSNERLIIAEEGEVMFSKEAVRAIGMDKLLEANKNRRLPRFHDGGPMGSMTAPSMDYMNRTGVIPSSAMASAMSTTRAGRMMEKSEFHLHVHGVTNTDEFKRSSATIWSQGSRMMDKGRKYR